mgnify:CR=1 FL=1
MVFTVSYPDPKQRAVLGWQIRWVASLFALLMVMAAAIPVAAVEPLEDTQTGALFASWQEERALGASLGLASAESIQSKSSSEAEREGAEETSLSLLPDPVRFFLARDVRCTARREVLAFRAFVAPERIAPRAPPLDRQIA